MTPFLDKKVSLKSHLTLFETSLQAGETVNPGKKLSARRP
jgi:hypothetical protein